MRGAVLHRSLVLLVASIPLQNSQPPEEGSDPRQLSKKGSICTDGEEEETGASVLRQRLPLSCSVGLEWNVCNAMIQQVDPNEHGASDHQREQFTAHIEAERDECTDQTRRWPRRQTAHQHADSNAIGESDELVRKRIDEFTERLVVLESELTTDPSDPTIYQIEERSSGEEQAWPDRNRCLGPPQQRDEREDHMKQGDHIGVEALRDPHFCGAVRHDSPTVC